MCIRDSISTQQTSVRDKWTNGRTELTQYYRVFVVSCLNVILHEDTKSTYSELGTSMLLAIKPQFTRITTITNKLNNVYGLRKSTQTVWSNNIRQMQSNVKIYNRPTIVFWATLYFWPGNSVECRYSYIVFREKIISILQYCY